jgi:hypothetical protein
MVAPVTEPSHVARLNAAFDTAMAFAVKSEAGIPGMFRGMFDSYIKSSAGRAMLLELVREIAAADDAAQAKGAQAS